MKNLRRLLYIIECVLTVFTFISVLVGDKNNILGVNSLLKPAYLIIEILTVWMLAAPAVCLKSKDYRSFALATIFNGIILFSANCVMATDYAFFYAAPAFVAVLLIVAGFLIDIIVVKDFYLLLRVILYVALSICMFTFNAQLFFKVLIICPVILWLYSFILNIKKNLIFNVPLSIILIILYVMNSSMAYVCLFKANFGDAENDVYSLFMFPIGVFMLTFLEILAYMLLIEKEHILSKALVTLPFIISAVAVIRVSKVEYLDYNWYKMVEASRIISIIVLVGVAIYAIAYTIYNHKNHK
jgi:hypothetical protein